MKNTTYLTTPSRFASHPFNSLKRNLFPNLTVRQAHCIAVLWSYALTVLRSYALMVFFLTAFMAHGQTVFVINQKGKPPVTVPFSNIQKITHGVDSMFLKTKTGTTNSYLFKSIVAITFLAPESCAPVTDLTSEKAESNAVRLNWSKPEYTSQAKGYQVYRNDQLQNEQLIVENTYLDKNLPNGEYEYYVVTIYENDCVSEPSNITTESIEVGVKGVKGVDGVKVFPNPTTGQLTIDNGQLTIKSVELFDVYGRKLFLRSYGLTVLRSYDLTLFPAGLYFLKITTETGMVTKKIVKN